MTYKEAYKWFKEELKGGKCSDTCEQCNANEKALEAIEKQIPKPIIRHGYVKGELCTVSYVCPKCDKHVNIDDNFCKYCGQAFDLCLSELG